MRLPIRSFSGAALGQYLTIRGLYVNGTARLKRFESRWTRVFVPSAMWAKVTFVIFLRIPPLDPMFGTCIYYEFLLVFDQCLVFPEDNTCLFFRLGGAYSGLNPPSVLAKNLGLRSSLKFSKHKPIVFSDRICLAIVGTGQSRFCVGAVGGNPSYADNL